MFVLDITFSKFAIDQLVIDCRRQIIRRALKVAKQQQAVKRKSADCINILSWDDVIKELQQSLDHLDKLGSATIQEMKTSDDSRLRDYASQFDLTRSDAKKMDDLLMKMIIDGQTPEFVDGLRLAAKTDKSAIGRLSKQVLHTILNSMRDPGISSEMLYSAAEVLQRIVQQIQKHQESGGQLIRCTDVADILQPFCADPAVDAESRLTVLGILEKMMTLDDDLFLLLHRSQAIISTINSKCQITSSDVKSDDNRLALFNRLLLDSTLLRQFVTLGQLLLSWPKLAITTDSSVDPSNNPWCRLITCMLRDPVHDSVAQVLAITSMLHKSNDLSKECTMFIAVSLEKASNRSAAVKCILSSSHSELHEEAVKIIQQIPENVEDEELFDLILKNHLTPSTVSTAIFCKLTDYVLMSQQTDESVVTPHYLHIETVVSEVQEAGYQAEAGSVFMRHRSTHRNLRTFDAAFSILSCLFKR
jgi:hypothetical protein